MELVVQEQLLRAAELIARLAHQGQFDEQGVPYINHPIFVAGLLESAEEKTVGYLHDVVEDTVVTEADLRPIFGDKITDAVMLLTHSKEEDYFDYIKKLAPNELARRVKLADLTHNMDLSRGPLLTQREIARYEKYQKAYKMLTTLTEE
jgi:(p)ppGpp synthase/HD superfamily hydrolase